MNRQKRRWYPRKPICEGGTRGFITVGLAEVQPAIMLLLIGTGISLLIMFGELLVHFLLNRHKVKPLTKIKIMKKVFSDELNYGKSNKILK